MPTGNLPRRPVTKKNGINTHVNDKEHVGNRTVTNEDVEHGTKVIGICHLASLPIPHLSDALRGFEEPRVGIDSADDQDITSKQVQAFLDGIGPSL
ncbi:hypothetical protein B0I35DRAFT_436160 [Stachybotrys elegans]|uniref:Uncharacterized protein n=1 Tax=Stachybotrys elegans TaxID=80388 RepID=A0A8K0WQP6_9HYPO|nr:hypothetical protein B0I35DRAFT_436160 [Stachybotrys elegans]